MFEFVSGKADSKRHGLVGLHARNMGEIEEFAAMFVSGIKLEILI